MPSTDPARRRFQRWTSFYGQEGEIDAPGPRPDSSPSSASPPRCRATWSCSGTAHFLEVWNRERFISQADAQRLTDDDYSRLSEFGI